MKVTTLTIVNIKSFKGNHLIDLSPTINIFIGKNNSGKSTILNAICAIQKPLDTSSNITLGEQNGLIDLKLTGEVVSLTNYGSFNLDQYSIHLTKMHNSIDINGQAASNQPYVLPTEPLNIIYPYLSKRKVLHYVDTINGVVANAVSGNLTNLYAKIDRIFNPARVPAYHQYVSACKEILGFTISAVPKDNGKHAVYIIDNDEHIPISQMGEGIGNLLGLIVDLCTANNKIFIIEELENDIHPEALKALLNLIIAKSESNQFFLSTHSNIVMKTLGVAPSSKIFNVKNEMMDEQRPMMYLSTVTEVENDPSSRRQVLEDLGYELWDYDLYKGWLFLEESSAELVIREHLIRWFCPKLIGKIRTFSSNGYNAIETKLDDFNKLFVFLHLEPTYKNKVWVLLDGGESEKKVIDSLVAKYSDSGWNTDSFRQLTNHDFELYYPAEFQAKVIETLAIANKRSKREAKRVLLEDVKAWIEENDSKAMLAFKTSASEIIEILFEIQSSI